MGAPKALMNVGGEPWWRRQLDAVRRAGRASLWVVSDEVAAELGGEEPELSLARSDPDSTMFDSLMVGIDAIRHRPPGAIFVLPIDVPAAEPPTWDALAATGVTAAPAHSGKTGHPLYVPWKIVETILLDPESGPPGTRRLDRIMAPMVHRVRVADRAVVFNLNTPDDVAAWLAIG